MNCYFCKKPVDPKVDHVEPWFNSGPSDSQHIDEPVCSDCVPIHLEYSEEHGDYHAKVPIVL